MIGFPLALPTVEAESVVPTSCGMGFPRVTRLTTEHRVDVEVSGNDGSQGSGESQMLGPRRLGWRKWTGEKKLTLEQVETNKGTL